MTFEETETTSFIITMIAIIGLLVGKCYVRIRRKLDEFRFSKLEQENLLIALAEEEEEDGDYGPRPLVPKEPEVGKTSKVAVSDLFFPEDRPDGIVGPGLQAPHLIGSKEPSPHGPR